MLELLQMCKVASAWSHQRLGLNSNWLNKSYQKREKTNRSSGFSSSLVNHSLDSEVVSSQFSIIDLQHETSVLQGLLPHLTKINVGYQCCHRH